MHVVYASKEYVNQHPLYSNDSLKNQPSCSDFRCHNNDPASNILCGLCFWKGESQRNTAECQVNTHVQNKPSLDDAKQWICSVCTLCQQGLRPQSSDQFNQSDAS